jgi:hypothetical protein
VFAVQKVLQSGLGEAPAANDAAGEDKSPSGLRGLIGRIGLLGRGKAGRGS